MRTNLTVDQSAELIGRRINPERASIKMPVDAPYRTSGIVLMPVFSIGDLFSMLPKEVEIIGAVHSLGIIWDSAVKPKEWNVHYFHDLHVVNVSNSELIDALHQMLCRLIDSKYVKAEEL